MAPTSGEQERTISRYRTWLPIVGVVLVVLVLAAVIVLPLWGSNESQDKRDEASRVVTPFRLALDAYHVDILRLSTAASAYAATRSPSAREAYVTAEASMREREAALRSLAPAIGYASEIEVLIDDARTYGIVTARIIAAEDAGDDFESFRLIEQEGEPQLQVIDADASALADAADQRAASIRADVDRIDERERYAVGIAGTLGVIATMFVVWLIISNERLGRQTQAQRLRLDSVISDVPGVVWEAWGRPDAASQRIDFVSRHVEDMLGYSVEEWLATPNFWLTIVHPEDREGAAARAAEAFAAGGSSTNRFRWITKDGRVLWVEGHSTVIVDESGAPIGMRGVTIDVSDQIRAEEARDRERARFASMISSTDYGVYETDASGHLTYLNPAAEEMFGYRLEEVAGRETHALFHHSRADGTPVPLEECPIFRSTRTTTTYRGMETFNRRNGSRFPVEAACASIVIDGRATGTVVVFQDITERLRQEQLKDDFVAFASHELRNPLTSVKGFSRWLAGRVASKPATFDHDEEEAVAMLVQEADRMESIIDLFLDLARLESNRLPLEMEPVDLKRMLREECDRLRGAYPLALVRTALPDESVIAILDHARIRQVVGNLLDNAAKYSGDGAVIDVAVVTSPGWAVVSIKDNGPGIPLDDQPYVFDRYYRGQDAVASTRRGLGVGLFITKQLVDRLGGALSFVSQPGSGTEFTVRLPLVAFEDEDAPEHAPDITSRAQEPIEGQSPP